MRWDDQVYAYDKAALSLNPAIRSLESAEIESSAGSEHNPSLHVLMNWRQSCHSCRAFGHYIYTSRTFMMEQFVGGYRQGLCLFCYGEHGSYPLTHCVKLNSTLFTHDMLKYDYGYRYFWNKISSPIGQNHSWPTSLQVCLDWETSGKFRGKRSCDKLTDRQTDERTKGQTAWNR